MGLLDDFDAMPVDTIAKGLTSMSVKKPIVLDALTLLPHKEGASPIVLNQVCALSLLLLLLLPPGLASPFWCCFAFHTPTRLVPSAFLLMLAPNSESRQL